MKKNKEEEITKSIEKVEKIVNKDSKKPNVKNKKKKKKVIEKKELSHNQIMFCEEYIKTQNAKQSYLTVYKNSKPESAESSSIRMLGTDKIRAYIDERLKPIKDKEKEEEKKAIAEADEILETFTKIMRGEIKDQLGFDASLKDRISAGKELAKRYGLFRDPEVEEERNKIMPTAVIKVVDNSDLEKDLYAKK